MGDIVGSIFGGGGGGGSSSSSTSTSSNNVTVNTTNTIDTTALAQALTASNASTAKAVAVTAAAISQADSTMFQVALKQSKDTITALTDHMSSDSQANMLVALATAAALLMHGSK